MAEAVACISKNLVFLETLHTNSKSAKSVTVLMDPLISKNLTRSMHRPAPILIAPGLSWVAMVIQKSRMGMHSRMKTIVDAVSNMMRNAPQALMMHWNEGIGKIRYWKRMLVDTEERQAS